MTTPNHNVVAEKLRIAMVKNNDIKTSKLAELLECTPPNLSNKFKRNNFSESDMKKIAEALGYDVEITLVSKETGERI